MIQGGVNEELVDKDGILKVRQVMEGKTRDKIAKLSAEPIMERIRHLVTEEIQKRVCRPHCGKVCDTLCPEALTLRRLLVKVAWLCYVKTN